MDTLEERDLLLLEERRWIVYWKICREKAARKKKRTGFYSYKIKECALRMVEIVCPGCMLPNTPYQEE